MARKPGRQPLIAPALVKHIVELAADAVPRQHICAAVGIAKSTFNNWLARGRTPGEGDEPYVALLAAIKKAESDAVAVRVRRIQAAGVGGALVERKSVTVHGVTTVTERFSQPLWVADAWVLERLHPENFATNQRELAELRKLVNQLTAERAAADVGNKGALEAGAGRLELVEEIVTKRLDAPK